MPSGPFTDDAAGVCVRVRLTPKAAHERIQGVVEDAAGRPMLKAAVTAAPEGGKANAALIRMLAKAWRVPKSALSVVAGATDRTKTLRIATADAAEAAALSARLAAWAGRDDNDGDTDTDEETRP